MVESRQMEDSREPNWGVAMELLRDRERTGSRTKAAATHLTRLCTTQLHDLSGILGPTTPANKFLSLRWLAQCEPDSSQLSTLQHGRKKKSR